MSMNKQDLERGLAAYKQEKKRSTLKFVLLAAVGICAFLLIWQLIVQFKLVNVRSLPSPVKVLQTLIKKISTKNPDGNTFTFNDNMTIGETYTRLAPTFWRVFRFL